MPRSPASSTGEVRPVASLTDAERTAMRALLTRQFRDVTAEAFDADLGEKESVVLLTDGDGHLVGFSTLLRIETALGDEQRRRPHVEGVDRPEHRARSSTTPSPSCPGGGLRTASESDRRPVTAFFSGDTVVSPEARGAALLPRLWSQHVFAAARERPDRDTVWFLLSSGYRTYRFLPTFFRRFTPAFDDRTCDGDRALLAALAHARFGERYDPKTGIVRLEHPTPLRDDDLPASRLRDPHVAFFAQANPGWTRGDELACLTRIHPDNLTEAGRRMVGPALAAPYEP